MIRPALPLLLACALVAPAEAQIPYPAGVRDIAFPNTTGSGSATLTTTVHYPAQSAGRDTPILPRAGGYPVLVFLHGFAALGSFYPELGNHFAARGYVAVLSNTAQFAAQTQVFDGIALYPALRAANAQPGHFLQGALDLGRSAVAGHSMGGGSTANVLAAGVGYVAGICFAPLDAPLASPRIQAPLLVIHGTGDTVLPWQSSGLALYQRATAATGMRVLYLLNQDCNHLNVAGMFLGTAVDREVWARCAAVATGFLDRYLQGRPEGLEEVVGPTARTEPRLTSLYHEVESPELWSMGRPGIGNAIRLTVFAEAGPAAVLAAAGTASIPTEFGLLRLDPLTIVFVTVGAAGQDGLLLAQVPIPNDASLVGVRAPLQGIGERRGATLRFTSLLEVELER